MFSAFLLWKGEASDGAEEREIEMFALTSAGSKSREIDDDDVEIKPTALAITPLTRLPDKKNKEKKVGGGGGGGILAPIVTSRGQKSPWSFEDGDANKRL